MDFMSTKYYYLIISRTNPFLGILLVPIYLIKKCILTNNLFIILFKNIIFFRSNNRYFLFYESLKIKMLKPQYKNKNNLINFLMLYSRQVL